MSCSSSTNSCCQKPIVSVCLPQQSYTVTSVTGSTLFGPNPTPIAASGIITNDSLAATDLDVTFFRGANPVATISALAPGQARSFAITGFTSISATPTAAGGVAGLCMTEFFRPSI